MLFCKRKIIISSIRNWHTHRSTCGQINESYLKWICAKNTFNVLHGKRRRLIWPHVDRCNLSSKKGCLPMHLKSNFLLNLSDDKWIAHTAQQKTFASSCNGMSSVFLVQHNLKKYHWIGDFLGSNQNVVSKIVILLLNVIVFEQKMI